MSDRTNNHIPRTNKDILSKLEHGEISPEQFRKIALERLRLRSSSEKERLTVSRKPRNSTTITNHMNNTVPLVQPKFVPNTVSRDEKIIKYLKKVFNPSTISITDKQYLFFIAERLNFVNNYYDLHGHMPTRKEIENV